MTALIDHNIVSDELEFILFLTLIIVAFNFFYCLFNKTIDTAKVLVAAFILIVLIFVYLHPTTSQGIQFLTILMGVTQVPNFLLIIGESTGSDTLRKFLESLFKWRP